MKLLRYALLVAIFLTFTIQTASSTVILVLLKDNQVWIASDSLRTNHGDFDQVEKMHKAFGGLLLKYGNESGAFSNTSTDAEVHRLIETDKSIQDFQRNVTVELTAHAQANIKEVIRVGGLNDFIYYKNATIPMLIPESTWRSQLTGLTFISVENHKLIVQDWNPTLTVVPVKGMNGVRYRVSISNPSWITHSDDQLFVYPLTIHFSDDLKSYVSSRPDKLLPLLIRTEKDFPCTVGAPNILLTAFPQKQPNAKDELVISMLQGSLVGDWSIKAQSHPKGCTEEEAHK